MSEAKYGEEFITHEFDEAIAVQSMIVGSARKLAEVHPDPDAKRLIKGMVAADERQLRELRQLGKPYGATGTVEEVAGALGKLAAATLEKASEAESEAYEAHAVLLALKRKQQDSTAALLKIARDRKEAGLRDAAQEMLRETKGAAQELADALAVFAVTIASRTRAGRPAAGSRGA